MTAEPPPASTTTPSPAPVSTRRQRLIDDTRAEILVAARQLIVEGGARALTLRELARRCGFHSPAALYKYFGSREHIIAQLITQAFERLSAHLDRVPTELPPDERLLELGMAYMRFAAENPADVLCILISTSADAPRADIDATLGLAAAQMLYATLRQGVETGVFCPLDDEGVAVAAFGVWSLVHGMVAVSGMDLGPAADTLRADPRAVLRLFISRLKRKEYE